MVERWQQHLLLALCCFIFPVSAQEASLVHLSQEDLIADSHFSDLLGSLMDRYLQLAFPNTASGRRGDTNGIATSDEDNGDGDGDTPDSYGAANGDVDPAAIPAILTSAEPVSAANATQRDPLIAEAIKEAQRVGVEAKASVTQRKGFLSGLMSLLSKLVVAKVPVANSSGLTMEEEEAMLHDYLPGHKREVLEQNPSEIYRGGGFPPRHAQQGPPPVGNFWFGFWQQFCTDSCTPA